jgi:hypothetical protein
MENTAQISHVSSAAATGHQQHGAEPVQELVPPITLSKKAKTNWRVVSAFFLLGLLVSRSRFRDTMAGPAYIKSDRYPVRCLDDGRERNV